MKLQNIFKVGKKYSYIGVNFEEWFSGMEVEKESSKLYSKVLGRYMLDKEILEEFKPTEVTLGELDNHLDSMDKSFLGLFYIKDNGGVLRAVGVLWYGDGWGVDAYSVEDSLEWRAGYQVFSRNPFETQSETFGSSEPQILEQMIEKIKEAGYQVAKIM